ncbi:MAG: tetratricopeptide repeat protein [Kordia sp.]|uniref:tetratricopeptide repeat protein n=1 Tax=Kordia sp. TaxID=1965332 RepID=UPI00385DC693
MKIRIVLFLIACIVTNLTAQNKLTDSIQSLISQAKTEQEKLGLLNDLSNAFKTTNGQKVLEYAEKALVLAQKLGIASAEGKAYLNLGNGNIITGNYDKSVAYFSKAKDIFEAELAKNPSIDIKKNLARAYGSIGVVSSEQNNYSSAFDYYVKSIVIYEELEDINMLSRLYNNVGVAYQSQKDYAKALAYFEKAKDTQAQLNDPNIGITLTNIANCYRSLQKYPEALKAYQQAEKQVQSNPRALGEWHNSVGLYYKAIHNENEALNNWDKAIVAFNTIDDKFGIADTYIFKGELFYAQKNYSEAIENAAKALELAKKTNVLEQIRNAEHILSNVYEAKGNFAEALKHSKIYWKLNDSLTNVENIRKGVQAEMNFEYEKKENSARLIRERNELLKAKEDKQRTTKYLLIGFSLLLLIGLGFLYYKRMELKKRLTLEKELSEYEQKALHLQMNPHFIFNCLGAISGFIINNGTDHAIKYLAKFSKLMRLTLEYSQESLIPIEKEIESLQNYLELEKLRFDNAFRYIITKSETIEDDMGIPPLLIQPLIENAIMHGIIVKKKQGNITVNFQLKKDTITCMVIDDGIGIENSKKAKENSVQVHKSMALDIIKKRLKMMTKVSQKKASMHSSQLQDANGNSVGTKVVITLPIQYID